MLNLNSLLSGVEAIHWGAPAIMNDTDNYSVHYPSPPPSGVF